jgi:chromosome segregation ATPase
MTDTQTLTPAELDRLADQLSDRQRRKERQWREQAERLPDPAEYQRRAQRSGLLELKENRARAENMAAARDAALARARKDREKAEQAIARVGRERAELRARFERELASLAATERPHVHQLSALAAQVEEAGEAARRAPVTVKVTDAEMRPAPRDAGLIEGRDGNSLAAKLGRMKDKGRALTAQIGAQA